MSPPKAASPAAMDHKELQKVLPKVVDQLAESVIGRADLQHLNQVLVPSRDAVVQLIAKLREVIFPGYFGTQQLSRETLRPFIAQTVTEAAAVAYEQVRRCLRYRAQIPNHAKGSANCRECDLRAQDVVRTFVNRLPAVRDLIADDVQAAFDSDPAASSTDETIFCYPGLSAIFVQRLAHELYALDVPLMPRIMTEHAHSLTGVDIHPGAQLGRRLFIDHGTGVVIGETTTIGSNVKIYQGVTLGALAPQFGQQLRGTKRHPTIEDDVIIYSNATILGGETVIGAGALIGGNVFITSSVPAHTRVTAEPPKLNFKTRRRGRATHLPPHDLDFQI